ncbi:MAG TPA: GAF domain-containing protein [Chloroflexota bacterium]|nr:GAF domain-containing protein [Chloroflexota bacterium]
METEPAPPATPESRERRARPKASARHRGRPRTASAALALAALQWHERAQRRGRILTGLAALAGAPPEGRELTRYFRQLCEAVAEVLGAASVCLWRLDPTAQHLQRVAVAPAAAPASERLLPCQRGLAGVVLARRTLLEVLNAPADRLWRARALAEGVSQPHYAGVPLLLSTGPAGVLALQRSTPTPLDPDERAALWLFAQQASLAIEQAWLVDTLRHRAAETEHLYQIGRQLARSLELDEVLPQVAAAARATLDADRAVVLLLRPDGETLYHAAVAGLPLPQPPRDLHRREGLWDRVLTTRQPVVVQNVLRVTGVYRSLTDAVGIRSFIHVPILLDEVALGILNCAWTRPGAVPPDAARRLGALADQAAIAIRNAQLYEAVRAARDRLDAIWRHAAQPIMVLQPDGAVTAWNPAAEALFGPPVGESPARPLPAAEWARLWAALQHAPAGEHVQAEVLARDSAAEALPILITLAPLRDAAGQITAGVAVVTDLRAQKRQEAERVQTERLHALGQLAAGVAHDFNNALAAIASRAELLRQEYGPWHPALHDGLEALVRGAMDAGATVRRILDFARERPERPLTRVALDDVVQDVETLTRPLWRAMAQARAVPLRLELALGAPPPILGDAAELREALINLIHNAVAAMPHGGVLTVTTGSDGQRAFLAVHDTGVGMDEATQARIFEPFFTTKGAQGTGLGLSMVYGTVRRHRGEIVVQSAPGRGSTFTLWFPLATAEASSAPVAPEAAAPLRILVVDDEPLLATMLARMLALDGHTVATCTSGLQALDRCRAEPFDLVLTDVSMPDVNGWEVARLLRTHQPDTAVAFLTGWGQHLDTAALAAVGVQRVLAKPFRREDLQRLVAEVAASRAARASAPGPDEPREGQSGQPPAYQVEPPGHPEAEAHEA